MARPRATDDFRAIRARMEELRRVRVGAGSQNDRPAARAPYTANGRDGMVDKSGLAPELRRMPVRGRGSIDQMRPRLS
jgi:hypothetical protein